MFRNKTAIIIGAGASCEVELPTGAKLKEKIAALVDIRFGDGGYKVDSGDLTVIEALRHHAQETTGNKNINALRPACLHIRDAMPQSPSIDNFIDIHPNDPNIAICGKLAIARAILQEEKGSLLRHKGGGREEIDIEAIKGTWFNLFVQLLAEACPLERLPERLQSLTLVIFNYDRCVEHFLYHSFQNVYKASPSRAAELVNSIAIFHPYGSVGKLPWQEAPGVAYGAEPAPAHLLAISKQLKTFTEGTNPKASDIIAIRERMLEAQVLVFLGFRFHRLNMQLLIPEEAELRNRNAAAKHVFATGKGLSQNDCRLVKTELVRYLGAISPDEIYIDRQHKCADLFVEYWRALSIG